MYYCSKSYLLLMILFIFSSIIVKTQQVTHYDLKVKLDVHSRQVSVDGSIDINFEGKDTISLVLWKNTKIQTILGSDAGINFRFDTASKSPIMYIPQGRKLLLSKSPHGKDDQKVLLKYECDFTNLNGWAKTFTDEWIEINYYCAWFPLNGSSTKFTSKLKISIDDDYIITGSGIIKKNQDNWEMTQTWGSFDNVIIASSNLKSKALAEKGVYIETDYAEFPDSGVDSVITECKYAFDLYTKYFGAKDSAYLKFIMSPFNGRGGYSRKNFVSLGTTQFSVYTMRGIGHELAHFWWLNAETTTWEDWLNEAFAEYSMLFYLRSRLGDEIYKKRIAEYKERTKKSKPIIGVDRATPEAYYALYEKGALILVELEEKLGSERFYDFMRLVHKNKIKNTKEMLSFVENNYSKDLSLWLENKLN